MKQTKLIRFLMLFDKEEFKNFGLFVNSPYFNRLRNVYKLYLALKKYHPGFESRTLTKENIFGKIFPGQKYDDIKMRALFSYLFTLAEKFMAIEYYSANKLNPQIDSIESLSGKGEKFLAQKILKTAESAVLNLPFRNEEYYYSLYKMILQKNILSSYFSGKMSFRKETDAFTIYFIATFLRTHASAFSAKSLLETDVRADLIETVVKIAQMEPYSRIPIIKMNFALYMITKCEDEKYFFSFLELLEKYPSVYSKKDLSQEIYHLLFHYCVIKIQKGDKKYMQIKFNLYKKHLSEKIYDTEKYFPLYYFNNIIVSALQNKDITFAKNFIEEYKGRLQPGTSDYIIQLSYMKIYYHLKEYDLALECLSKIKDNEDLFLKQAVKDAYIKIFYETGNYEQVFSVIDSYKHFLSKNRLLSSELKKRYRLYLNIAGELLRAKVKPDKNKILELKKNLENSPGFVYKDWIMEKLEEIEK